MLVLTRKVGERIQIGDNISVVVTRVSANRVTLGVEAPSEVRIVRGELQPVLDSFEQGQQPATIPFVSSEPDPSAFKAAAR